MALSNIFQEPRREITETAVGLVLVSGFFLVDYRLARWLLPFVWSEHDSVVGDMLLLMGLGVVFFIMSLFLVSAIHGIGELACNYLEKNGVRLRPRRRV